MRPVVALALLLACRDVPREETTCSCTPGNRSLVKPRTEARPMDGHDLLNLLRRHKRDVQHGRNARDIKVDDDELRFAISNFCQPCGTWVGDSMRLETLYPLDRLDDATHAVCLGLVLRDGTTVYGDARPTACRL